MKQNIWLFLAAMLVNSWCYATSFQPVSNQAMIQEADIIVKGTYISKNYQRLEDGKIATELIFEVQSEYGLNSKEIKIEEVSIYYPGGKIGDVIQQIEGIPEFLPGQKSLILARVLDDGRVWGLSLGLGTYHVVKMGSKEMLINSIFPSDALMSSWDWEYFQDKVKKIKSEKMNHLYLDKYSDENQRTSLNMNDKSVAEEGKNRSIASINYKGENRAKEENESQSFGLIFLLGILGGLSGFMARQKRRIK